MADAGDAAGRAVRVVLVDDHPVVRAGLRALLGGQDDLAVVGEAGDLDAAERVVAAAAARRRAHGPQPR